MSAVYVNACSAPINWIVENSLNNLIIFDLDGVITSEESYWDCAGLTLHELLYSPRYCGLNGPVEPYQPVQTAQESRQLSRATFPLWLI